MRVLHLADLHYGNDPAILEETDRCSHYALDYVSDATHRPDVIVIAGDTVDEFVGRIRVDSEASRRVIQFVQRAASIAPVVIVRGTPSHDRNTPFIFQHLRTTFPVLVAAEPMQASLIKDGITGRAEFAAPDEKMPDGYYEVAAFTLVPQLDKCWLEADGIKEGNRDFRELFHDLMAGYGVVNSAVTVPRILVTHGMVTGATFSSGQQAVGDDLEMPLSALRAAKCDYVALGHVHRMQVFGSDVAYCGSPGRLNFGEPEEKCLLLVDVKHGESPVITAVPTPARRFVFIEADIDSLHAEIAAVADQINGAHVRVRFTVPEERRHEIDREAIEAHLLLGGAVAVKVEGQVIPMTRQRAAGISHVTTLAAKVQRWGTAVGVEIPERVLLIASEIEGLEVTELQAKFCGEEGSRAQFSEVA